MGVLFFPLTQNNHEVDVMLQVDMDLGLLMTSETGAELGLNGSVVRTGGEVALIMLPKYNKSPTQTRRESKNVPLSCVYLHWKLYIMMYGDDP